MHHHSESVIRFDRCTQLEPSVILLHEGEKSKRNADEIWTCSTNSRRASNYLWYLTKGWKTDCKSSFFTKFTGTDPFFFSALDKSVIKPRDCKFCLTVTSLFQDSFPQQSIVVQLVCLFSHTLSLSLVSSLVSDAAGHNRVYLRAGLDHLSRHRGKQGALAVNVFSSCCRIKVVMLGGQSNVLRTCYTWLCF